MAVVHGTTAEAPLDIPLGNDRRDRLERLRQAIDHAGHLLPAQGPITVFIHHNTLHAFEDLPFDKAVQKGARIFGCHPYLSEEQYRERFVSGRIQIEDINAVLHEDLQDRAVESILGLCTRLELRQAMLVNPLCIGPAAELRWFVAETNALSRFRKEASGPMREQILDKTRHWVMRDVRGRQGLAGDDQRSQQRLHDMLKGLFTRFGEATIEKWPQRTWEAFTLQALWRVCREGAHGHRVPSSPVPVRHRDLLLEMTGVDSDAPVQELLIRFCASYLDQGFAHWQSPVRDHGYFASFCALYRLPAGPPDHWRRRLPEEIERIASVGLGAHESILESLELLGVSESEWPEFLSSSLLALRGWAGMIRQIEIRGDRAVQPIPEDSLLEFLAIQLVLERLSLTSLARSVLGYVGPLSQLRSYLNRRIVRHSGPTVEQRAFEVFQLAQVLGWSPADLHRLSKADWGALIDEIEAFSGMERRRVFHRAFERHYRQQALDALSLHNRKGPRAVDAPRAQVIFCLDEREESIRRHLEELDPSIATLGAAGFFSVAMYYQGVADAHFVPLCPVVIRPGHWVAERPIYSLEDTGRRRAKTRWMLGQATHRVHMGSRTFASGTLLAAGVGVLASIPLLGRILFPRVTARVRRALGKLVAPPQITQLLLERRDGIPGMSERQLGFNVEEMANCAERLLRDLGLTTGFSPLVALLGHSSSSLNNPHNSAYNCGACGGNSGGPNARAMAQILNDPRVRQLLFRRGLEIPPNTVFVGGLHNTCDDSIRYYDLDRMPVTHREDFDALRQRLSDACDRNAHERCRRFQSAPLTLTFSAARDHVEERSEDLAQTRPECGHATNAVCVVGRRSRTRGLFMDRRAFLVSYDPTQDQAGSPILTRILQAVFPVCGGINLEYYFSYVDSAGWGCGTKLPHNVTSLLGVMDGAASDLRTGLPWQMVEIHEPVRLLFVIETTPAEMLDIIDRNPAIGAMCRNEWVQLATLDPTSSQIHLFQREAFHPYQPVADQLPVATTSPDWYRGWREHLEFAEIGGSN